MNILHKYNKGFINIIIALTVGVLAICTGVVINNIIHSQFAPQIKVGAVNYPTGGGTYRLASSISSSQTTIKLSSFKEPVSGLSYTMTYLNSSLEYGTLDPQTTNSEFISFNGITQNSDGTATLTGVIRGLSKSYPFTASSTFQVTHSGQSVFILSNPPQLYNDIYTYINGLAFGGIGGASEAATGTVQIATGAQASIGATNGNIGRLALPASLATSSWLSIGGSVNKIPVTGSGGYIDPNFLNASTTRPVSFATSTTYIGNFPAYNIGKNVQIFTSVGTTTFSIPSGISSLHVQMVGGGGGGGGSNSATVSGAGGGAGAYVDGFVNVTGTSTTQVVVGSGGAAGSNVPSAGSIGVNSRFGYTDNPFMTAIAGQGGASSGTGIQGLGGATTTQSTLTSLMINSPGGSGCNGMTASAWVGNTGVCGGSSFFGGGVGNSGSSGNSPYGSGGAAGSNGSATVGSPGIVIISW